MTDATTTTENTAQVDVNAALQTIEAMAPVILEAATVAGAASGNPEVDAAIKLAPLAIQALKAANQMAQAGSQLAQSGGMTPGQLAALFTSISSGIQRVHDTWAALNTAASSS